MEERYGGQAPGGHERDVPTRLAMDSDDPEAIRAEIRRTRARMSGTVEEIGDRLNPHRVKHQVKQSIHDATIGKAENMARSAAGRVDDTRHTIMDTIRDNPLPAAMAGIGLGWLFVNGRRDNHESYAYDGRDARTEMNPGYYGSVPRPETGAWGTAPGGRMEYGYAGTEGAAGRTGARDISDRASELKHEAMDRGEELSDRASELRHRAEEEAHELKDRAQDRVTGIAHEARDMAHDVSDRAHDAMETGRARGREMANDLARQTRYNAHRVEDRFEETLRDRPLAIGAAAVAVGLAVGLSAPSTSREANLMGGARDRMVDKARDRAHEVTDRARDVAERVADEAKATARDAVQDESFG
ncbi:MAG: DUF3618 domain-containing protein [Gemmatimonadota bacterium]